MSLTEYQAQVRKLWASFDRMPRTEAQDAAYEAWLPALMRFELPIVRRVIGAACDTDERLPNVGQIVRRCQDATKGASSARYVEDQAHGDYPVKRMDVVGVLRAMRKVAEDPERKRLEHDHRKGAELCPICGAHDRDDSGLHAKDCAWCARLADASIGVLEQFLGRPLADPPADRPSRCRNCDGYGWRPEYNDDVRPCATCRPEQHRRWAEGHWHSGHDCDECRAIREGRFRPATA